MIKIENDHFSEAVNALSQVNVADCTGSCNEVKAAAQAWLDDEPGAVTRLHAAAKTALVKDDACGCHLRDSLLNCVIANGEE